jgi:hypothetical protein
MAKIVNQMRKAIKNSEKSRYAISKLTGVSQSQLCLFMSGKKGMSYDTFERVAGCLGLDMVLQPKKRKGKS